ncbi:MAG: hypothetical protein M3R53_03365 [Candidatus Eremiobacteraeota bacterium]|nr:hypothetical protein [Candidatus Eremiobacteraeota bacterium]
MDSLLQCDACRHGAALHDGSGCEVVRCACLLTREDLIADGLAAAKQEIRTLWERPGVGPS